MTTVRDTAALERALASAPALWSARIVDVATSETLWEHEPARVLKTASVGKLFLLIEIARQSIAEELDLDERVTRTDDDWIAESGLWHLLAQPSLTIRDACVLIGAVSDNLATNVLVRRIGLEKVTATTESLGYEFSRLLDRVRCDRGPDDPPTLSVGCAAELVDLMARLQHGTVISPDVSSLVLRWLAGGADLSMVASAFALDPLAHVDRDRGVLLYNKTGTIADARIDVGVVDGVGATLAYAVLANWDDDDETTTDEGGSSVGARDAILQAMGSIGSWIRGAVAVTVAEA